MSYEYQNTKWAASAKGNEWRQFNGRLLIVGEHKQGGYWARISGRYLKHRFMNAAEAKAAIEEELKKMKTYWWE